MSRKPKLKLSDSPRFKRLAARYPTLIVFFPLITAYLIGVWDGWTVQRGFGVALAIVVSMFVVSNVVYWFNSYFRLLVSKNPATIWYLNVMQYGRVTHDHKYQAQLVVPDNFGSEDEILTWKIPNTALELMMARSGPYATLRNTEIDQTIMLTNLQALQLSSSLMTATLMLGDDTETIFEKAPVEAYDPTLGVRLALWLNRKFTRTKNPEGTK